MKTYIYLPKNKIITLDRDKIEDLESYDLILKEIKNIDENYSNILVYEAYKQGLESQKIYDHINFINNNYIKPLWKLIKKCVKQDQTQ